MTESYHSFLTFVDNLAIRKRPSDRALLEDPLFRRLIATAHEYRDCHPKVQKLGRLLHGMGKESGKSIVFFGDKKSAEYCRTFLDERGVRAETVFGGKDSNARKRRETIETFRTGPVSALLATSVLHEGISIPEVDLVVNYSVAYTGIARLQSGGRTGRMRPGYITHLVLNHDLDRQVFWSVDRELANMRALLAHESLPKEERVGQLSLFVS